MKASITFFILFLSFPLLIFGQGINHARKKPSESTTGLFSKNFEPILEPFYHGVASGDPTTDGVIIWTRITPDMETSLLVNYEIALDTGFVNVVQSGSFQTDANRDFTVKVPITGLNSGTTYYYQFEESGRKSIVGRTKTLPTGSPDQLKFGVVSCNNYQSGYFNAFGRIAERNDLDAIIHLGDFIYEYAEGGFGFDPEINRGHDPDQEILNLSDYRIRYGFYRLDPDLRRAMQQHPFIHIWDDHEVANDAWRDGAQNHDPVFEGDYQTRKSDATKAFFEWVPISDNPDSLVYRTLEFGDLARLVLLDTRHEERTLQVDSVNAPNINDPDRKLLGDVQFEWFKTELQSQGQQWKLIGNQVLFSHLLLEAFEPLFPGVSNGFLDIWQGYPARRDSVLAFLEEEAIENAVFLTGDIHVAMAFDVSQNPEDPMEYDPDTGDGTLAVEFVTPSISSNNFDEAVGLAAAALFQGVFPGANPHSEFVDFIEHGYFLLDVDPNRVQADYYFVPTVRNPDQTESFACGVFSLSGDPFLQKTNVAAPPKPIQEIPAPDPTLLLTSLEAVRNNTEILAVFPNPVSDFLTINFALNRTERIKLELYSITGQPLKLFFEQIHSPGNYQFDLDLPDLPVGNYIIRLTTPTQNLSRLIQKM